MVEVRILTEQFMLFYFNFVSILFQCRHGIPAANRDKRFVFGRNWSCWSISTTFNMHSNNDLLLAKKKKNKNPQTINFYFSQQNLANKIFSTKIYFPIACGQI